MPESLHLVLPVLQTYLPPDANASVALRTAAIFPVHFQADGLAIRIYLDIRQRIPAGHIPLGNLQKGVRTGKFRLGKDDLIVDEKGDSFISVEDYAMAMVDELEQENHHRERFTIGY